MFYLDHLEINLLLLLYYLNNMLLFQYQILEHYLSLIVFHDRLILFDNVH
jgi:hypothetical protein